MTIKQAVYTYPTKHKQGFTNAEILELLKQLLGRRIPIDLKKFYASLAAWRTATTINKQIITYHIDVLRALTCANEFEFD